jgi:uncharacterized membrane protein YesL
MAAFRTLWRAAVGLYEETLVLVAGNVAALVLNLPIGLALFLIALPFLGSGSEGGTEGTGAVTQWLLVTIAWLMPFLPTPGNVALAGLTRVAAGPDVPRFSELRNSLVILWRLSLKCSSLSVLVTVALVANVYFYALMDSGLRFASILWLYGTLFWLSLHIYLVPLLVHVAEPRMWDLYRRAAFIALGHFGYTLLLLAPLLVVSLLAVVFPPVYVLVGLSFFSLVQAHALREIRRRHGDLVVETEEETGQL